MRYSRRGLCNLRMAERQEHFRLSVQSIVLTGAVLSASNLELKQICLICKPSSKRCKKIVQLVENAALCWTIIKQSESDAGRFALTSIWSTCCFRLSARPPLLCCRLCIPIDLDKVFAMTPLLPAAIPPPFARYSHGMAVPEGYRFVFTSGPLGVAADWSIPDDVEAQADLCFNQIAAILADADMTLADIVRLNAYVTDRAHMAGYMKARDRRVATPPPASTLMIVSGFTKPEFKVEIEVIAAKSAV